MSGSSNQTTLHCTKEHRALVIYFVCLCSIYNYICTLFLNIKNKINKNIQLKRCRCSKPYCSEKSVFDFIDYIYCLYEHKFAQCVNEFDIYILFICSFIAFVFHL